MWNNSIINSYYTITLQSRVWPLLYDVNSSRDDFVWFSRMKLFTGRFYCSLGLGLTKLLILDIYVCNCRCRIVDILLRFWLDIQVRLPLDSSATPQGPLTLNGSHTHKDAGRGGSSELFDFLDTQLHRSHSKWYSWILPIHTCNNWGRGDFQHCVTFSFF